MYTRSPFCRPTLLTRGESVELINVPFAEPRSITTTPVSSDTIQACSFETVSSVSTTWHLAASRPISRPCLVIGNRRPESDPEVTCTLPHALPGAASYPVDPITAPAAATPAAMAGPAPGC